VRPAQAGRHVRIDCGPDPTPALNVTGTPEHYRGRAIGPASAKHEGNYRGTLWGAGSDPDQRDQRLAARPAAPMSAKPDRVDLLRQTLIFHAGAVAQLVRVRAAHQAMMDEVSLDKWVDGRPPTGSREAEFVFEYEYHFLLIAAAQLNKAMRQLGLDGFEQDLAGPVKDLRDWYTHFEEPQGRAFRAFIARQQSADPAKLVLTANEIDIGGGVLTLSTLQAALDEIGSKLPAYEQCVLAESEASIGEDP
jgi:hypothetical protein